MKYSSKFIIRLRSLSRKIGLNKFVASACKKNGYEDRFGSKLLRNVNLGDTVWDVGANVGLYTTQFAQRVGGHGTVVAFEPVPACFQELQRASREFDNIRLVNVALGASDGELTMMLEEESLAATHRIVDSSDGTCGRSYVIVPVRSGESFIVEHPELFPNVVKIDVEGFEGSVFKGLKNLLIDHRLRCIGIEVHFGLLQRHTDGQTVPREIERGLQARGFHVSWVDASHLIAVR